MEDSRSCVVQGKRPLFKCTALYGVAAGDQRVSRSGFVPLVKLIVTMPALEMITLWPPEKNIGVWAILLFERQKAYKVLFPEGYPKREGEDLEKHLIRGMALGRSGNFY